MFIVVAIAEILKLYVLDIIKIPAFVFLCICTIFLAPSHLLMHFFNVFAHLLQTTTLCSLFTYLLKYCAFVVFAYLLKFVFPDTCAFA